MCPGVPYAIAAKFAYPDKMPIALVGDGAMQMLGNNGLITISKYWKSWRDPRLVILVLNNRDLNQVTWEQRVMDRQTLNLKHHRMYPIFLTQNMQKCLGLMELKWTNRKILIPSMEYAFAQNRPVVIEVYTDPNVPPLPPHISFKQAEEILCRQ